VAKGAYVIWASEGEAEILLLATGSEVHLALAVKEELIKRNHRVQVVSMPSWELFEKQSAAYQEQVLPSKVQTRLAMEAGSSLGWHRWVGQRGDIVAVDRFGASARGERLMQELGFDVQSVTKRALKLLVGDPN
jgi:transketolase